MSIPPTGSETQVVARVGGQDFIGIFRERYEFKPGETINLLVDPDTVPDHADPANWTSGRPGGTPGLDEFPTMNFADWAKLYSFTSIPQTSASLTELSLAQSPLDSLVLLVPPSKRRHGEERAVNVGGRPVDLGDGVRPHVLEQVNRQELDVLHAVIDPGYANLLGGVDHDHVRPEHVLEVTQ